MQGYYCATCGEYHERVPLSFAADAPYSYEDIPEAERESRTVVTPDQCIIDDRWFFVRGVLEVPILGTEDVFTWGVWVSLSKTNFERISELWEIEGRENEPPYFGWLNTSLPTYPDTLNLKTNVHTRALGMRPLVEVQRTDHPLARDQHEGITLERARAIADTILHGSS